MQKFLSSLLLALIVCGLAGPIVEAADRRGPAPKSKPRPADDAPVARVPSEHLIQNPHGPVPLVEASAFMRVTQARTKYSVNGAGLTAAVLDTGLRTTHVDFTGRIPTQRNYSTDNGGNVNNATDGQGHGTNVSGIICANSVNVGFAPGASVIPIKVISNANSGQAAWSNSALDWVIANAATYNISVVNMSLGYGDNLTVEQSGDPIGHRSRIQTLRSMRIPVVIAAGNSFYPSSQEGMSYPAIIRESVSVGAIYDTNIGGVSYQSGAVANTTGPGRITPFSQRLHPTTNASTYTDIFSTGAALTSSGYLSDTGTSTQHGTSQAAPTIAGLILLGQQYHVRIKGVLPTVDDLERWLRASPYLNRDGDDEDDNVTNTNKQFIQADALHFLDTIAAEIGSGGQAPVINSPLTIYATVGEPMQYQVTATNSPTSFNISGFPVGNFSFSYFTGILQGTPTTPGTYDLTITATNAYGSDNKTLRVYAPYPSLQPPVIDSPTTATAQQGQPFSYQITATNSPTSYSAYYLPEGLNVNASTGAISGSPTQAGEYSVLLAASNAAGPGYMYLTLTVNAAAQTPVITSPLTAYATEGEYFTYQITATNSPTLYGAAGLPSGVVLSSDQNGVLNGTPYSRGTYYASIWASNSAGYDVQTLTIIVSGPPCTCPLTCIIDAGQRAIKGLVPQAAKLPAPLQRLLSSVREFRDNVLYATPEGRQLAQAYYGHGCELAMLAIDRPERVSLIQKLIEDLQPALAQAGATGRARISQADWDRGWKLIEDLHADASPALQSDLKRLQSFLLDRRSHDGGEFAIHLKDNNDVQLIPSTAGSAPRLSAGGSFLYGLSLLAGMSAILVTRNRRLKPVQVTR